MHVGCIEVVLLVPGGGRQNDIGIDASCGHAEIERDQKVELSFRSILMPHGLTAFLRAFLTQILAKQAVRRAKQVLQEILMPLARRTEQVRAPDEHVARPVGLVVRVLAGHGDSAVLQRVRDKVFRLLA